VVPQRAESEPHALALGGASELIMVRFPQNMGKVTRRINPEFLFEIPTKYIMRLWAFCGKPQPGLRVATAPINWRPRTSSWPCTMRAGEKLRLHLRMW
jgi:hypothetical protein